MKIAIASDHRGVAAKSKIKEFLEQSGYYVKDFGPASEDAVDYPDYAVKVAQAVSGGKVQRGILICGTGLGMCISANKIQGVRAATVHDIFTAEMSRRHNDANVLCMGEMIVNTEQMLEIVKVWLVTAFEGGRHQKRIDKIKKIEQTD
ncbi:MAG: ribose 5-phosphate isomerase B [Planctomycetota bacterium]